MAEIAEPAGVHRASIKDAADARALPLLAEISAAQWRALSERAAEPNGYYLPDWELAVDASARGRVGASALAARSEPSKLIGLVPVISIWRAWKIPLPALVRSALCRPPAAIARRAIPAGATCDSIVSNYDFLPSVLAHIGLAEKSPKQSPGRDYSRVLRGEKPDVLVNPEVGPRLGLR